MLDIIKHVKPLIGHFYNGDERDINNDSNLMDDLDYDDLDLIELLMDIERIFSIEISDEEWDEIKTVEMVYNIVTNKVNGKITTTSKEFIYEDLDFYLPNSFKGLSKKYILDCMFDEKIQACWMPKVGDLIVGPTGNIFAISGKHNLCEELGGPLYFFGGGLCNRTGGGTLNETYSSTMNRSGIWFEYSENGIVAKPNCYHSSMNDFKYLPYPHELKK